MGTILLLLALAMVLLWTVRLARSKGRNPWVWGGAAFLLMVIPDNFKLLAVVPMIVLMFMKNPQRQSTSTQSAKPCPKCQASSPLTSRFCTNCGWELGTLYSPDSPTEDTESSSAPSAEEPEPAKIIDGAGDMVRDEDTAEAPGEPVPEDPAPETTAPKKPVSMGAPTAAGMTERGVRLFNQGRIQESIDQFTKAIALDPNYIQAWARRAEAYARLGRGDEAEEDRRKLDALDASSSTG